MPRNKEWILIIFLLLLAASADDSPHPLLSGSLRSSQSPFPSPGFDNPGSVSYRSGSASGMRSRFSFPEPARLAGDFHHMVHVMNKVDHLGQMAVNPPKLPEPAELVNTDALPDLSGIMDMLSPLLKGSSSGITDNRE